MALKYTFLLLLFHLGFTNMSPLSLRFLGSVLPPTPTIVSEITLSFVCIAHILLSRFSPEWVPIHRSQSPLSPSHLNGRPLDSPAVGLGEFLPVQLLFSSWNTKHPVKTWWLFRILFFHVPLNIYCFFLLSSLLAMTPGAPCVGGSVSLPACFCGQLFT